ncbi:nucleotidyltransferase domain-containing protein [Treponema phagedenis]|uniref:nucleotidyltransferase domain-containing protein n=1 Tax=Treponema phagedenis TaxID=162 RepID=UPI0001F63A31|nr:nucleotidyltransferase domain-containing protein [Treponema phagedenis]EFW39114.1 hypothetical protein HMPREF9554_00356 [Treponema phagedenis F0421]QSH99420.1 nucleotidyltransferase domain-containing protein [Treponema phagedenis]TYT76520.1 nucleotidyltransferase domain-containing protein [Treponema phagedenis]TYT77743.1 nucleotidyltransferase domain-containing protein [Treponema phagedenis]
MRLTEHEKTAILDCILKHFSEPEQIILFGSRTDDTKKGGDTDLLVQTQGSAKKLFNEKIA